MAKENKPKRNPPEAPSMTVEAMPRLFSATPPRTRVKDADVQGETTKKGARKITGTKLKAGGKVKKDRRDGIALRGKTRA